MSIDSKEIELIIRAQNQSKSTLDDVAKSISSLNTLIDNQAEASKRGSVGLDELRNTVLNLQAAQEKLKSSANLVSQFEASGAAAEKAAERTRRAQEKLENYSASNKDKGENGEITEKRAAALTRLEASLTRATAAEQRRTEMNQKLAVQLKELGIAEDDLAGTEAKLRQSAAELGLSIGRASDNVAKYTDNLKAARQAAKEQAETELFAKQAADAAKLVHASEYIAFWTKSLEKKEAIEKEQRDNELFQKEAAEAARLAKAADYVYWWTNALEKQDAEQKRVANQNAAGKLADDAEKTARAFTTLAGSATEATPKVTGLFTTLRGIAEPAASARQNLDGLEQGSRKLATSIDAINGPVKEYRTTLQALQATQKEAYAQGTAVDAYRSQMLAVQAARQEFIRARADVLQLAAAIRAAQQPNEQLNAALRGAQAELQRSAGAMRNSVSAAQAMRTELRAAGVDTSNLANAEERLIAITRQNTQSMHQLNAAVKEHGQAVETADGKLRLFGDGGRTTLSLFQRFRGEILALTASYLGLQAAIGGTKEVLEALVAKQAIENRLGVVVGTDPKKIGAEYDYVHGQAMRLGIGIESLSDSYSKFAINAKGTNLNLAQTKFAFESLTEVMRVNHASDMAIGNAFEQFSQMLAKGKVQMDDLKQAANWLPGLRATMAKGLAEIGYAGIGKENPTGDMLKQMKAGAVDAGVALHAVAVQMRKDYAEQLPEALHALQAEQGRFNTAVFDFKMMVADSGFGKAYTEFLRHLTGMMSKDEGAQFAQKISDALVKTLDLLKLFLDNLDLIKEALILTFMIKGTAAVIEFTANLPGMIAKIKEMSAALNAASGWVGALQKSFLLLSAFFVGWEVGSVLYEKFAVVRYIGATLVRDLLISFEYLKAGFSMIMDGVTGVFKEAFANIFNMMTYGVRQILSNVQGAASLMGQDDIAAKIGAGIDTLTAKTDGWGTRIKKIRNDWAETAAGTSAEIKKIKEITDQQLADIVSGKDRPQPKPAAPLPGATQDPGAPKSLVKPDDKEAKKRARAIQEIENEIGQMRARLDRKESDSLESRLRAYEEQYTALMAKIRKLGGSEAAAFAGTVQSIIGQLRAQETEKYQKELNKEREQLVTKLDQANVKGAKGFEEILDAKLNQIRDKYKQLYADLDQYEKKLRGNGKGDANNDELARIAAWRAGMQTSQAGEERNAGNKAADEAIKEREKEVNGLLDERKRKIDAIKDAEKAGDLSPSESLRQQRQVIDEMQPRIEAMAQAAIAYAQAMGANLEPDKLMRFTAQMHLAEKSALGLKTEIYSIADANKDLAGGATTTIKALAEGLGKAVVGAGNLSDAFRGAGQAFLKFAADFLLKIGEMIVRQQIMNALSSMGAFGGSEGMGAAVSGAVSAMVLHTGGVVGGGGGTSTMAASSWFTGAPRYHTGGIPGLQPNEYAAVLKQNEEVLTADDPRNVLNGSKQGGAAPAQTKMPDLKIVNAIDSGSMIDHGLSTTSGQQALFNFMRANREQVKTVLGN